MGARLDECQRGAPLANRHAANEAGPSVAAWTPRARADPDRGAIEIGSKPLYRRALLRRTGIHFGGERSSCRAAATLMAVHVLLMPTRDVGTIEEAPVSERTITKARPDGDPRTTAVLMLAAIREASAHLGKLLRLARTEFRGNLRALTLLVVLFGGALLLVLASLVLFLIALRDALAALIGNEPLAALIVALPFVVVMVMLAHAGFVRMRLRAPEA